MTTKAQLQIELAQAIKERDEALDKLRRAEPVLHIARTPEIEWSHRNDYKHTFKEFWADIVMNEDGGWNFDQVKRELHDFAMVIDEVSKVYMHVTDGLFSKSTTRSEHIIGAFDCKIDDDYEEKLEWIFKDRYALRCAVKSALDNLKEISTDLNKSTALSMQAEFIRNVRKNLSTVLNNVAVDPNT